MSAEMAATGSGGKNSLWLVKSGDRVTGPFATEEIVNKLRSKEVVVIDELMSPESRWRYVRDEPVFADIVEEIRKGLMASKEDTEVQTESTQTSTDTDLVSNFHDNTEAHFVPTVSGVKIGLDSAQVKDAEFVETVDPSKGKEAPKPNSVRTFGLQNKAEPQKPVKSGMPGVLIWLFTGVAIAGVGGAAYLVHLNSKPEPPPIAVSTEFDETLLKAQQAWFAGDYPFALQAYRRASQIRPKVPEVTVRLALLTMSLEGQTLAAKRMLLDSMSDSARSKMHSEALLVLGLAALQSDDFDDAKAQFQKAEKIATEKFASQFNQGVVEVLRRSHEQAARHFRDSVASSDEPVALISLARSLMDSGRSNYKEALKILERVSRRFIAYRQEALALAAFIELEMGSRKRSLARLKDAYDTDPNLTQDHLQNPLLNLSHLSWDRILPLCRTLNDKLKVPLSQAFLSICLSKTERREEASKVVSGGLASGPDDPVLNSAHAYLLYSTGREADAKGALRFAAKGKQPHLASFVQGRVCMKTQDIPCAEAAWSKLLKEVPPPLAALVGLAEIRAAQGNTSASRELMEQAESYSPLYIPVLRHANAHGSGVKEKP